MIVTVAQYIESLSSGDGRFRTLERLRPLRDRTGEVSFTIPGHGFVDFDVAIDGARHTLRCPLRYDARATATLRAMAEKERGFGSAFFTEWELLPAEMVLFGTDDTPFEIDILARPAPVGERLADFINRAIARADAGMVAAVARSFEELVEWTHIVGRSGITPRNIYVTSGGEVSLAAFSATDETPRVREMLHAVLADETMVDAAAHSRRDIVSGYDSECKENVRLVRDGGGWMYVDRHGRAVIDAVWRSASPFRDGRAVVETGTGKGLIDRSGASVLDAVYEEVVWDDRWGVAVVAAEGRWSLVDRNGRALTRDTFEWIGECSEGLIVAMRDGLCGYLDTEGRLVVPCIYEDAASFAEGCAPVTSDGESFLIDGKGDRI